MAFNAQFAAGGGDPRLSNAGLADDYIRPQNRPAHDHTVTFEEYHYYANETRRYEDTLPNLAKTGILQVIFPPKAGPGAEPIADSGSPTSKEGFDEKTAVDSTAGRRYSKAQHMPITDAEWINASRAVRTATWAACFYLITTDILGPFGVSYVLHPFPSWRH